MGFGGTRRLNPERPRGSKPAIKGWRILRILALPALLPPGVCKGQQLDLHGYFEHTLQGVVGRGVEKTEAGLLDASKLRLDLASVSEEGWGFRGNVNFVNRQGALEFDISPYVPSSVRRDLEEAGAPTTFHLENSRIWLDNAFLFWTKDGFRVRMGRQQLSWGSGYGYNPTDLFHIKDPLDPTYEKEGVGALRLDYRWGIGGESGLIVVPGKDARHSGLAVRLGTHLEQLGYDMVVTLHQVQDSTGLDRTTLLPRHQQRRAVGFDVSGSVAGLGVWMEGNQNFMEEERDFLRIVVGLDYTAENGTYLMAEALFNGRAERRKPYPMEDWLSSLLSGEPVGPWWILTGARRDITALSSIELFLFSAPDGSFALNPRLEISVAQNAELTIYGGFTVGSEEGSFSPGLALGLARATIFF
jgi:hypothetical protein